MYKIIRRLRRRKISLKTSRVESKWRCVLIYVLFVAVHRADFRWERSIIMLHEMNACVYEKQMYFIEKETDSGMRL